MRHVVIGVPARNEGSNIAQLAGALEAGAALLGEVATCELVLAYQTSTDDTLVQWVARPGRLPRRVLYCSPELSGKGRNVKLLVDYSRERDADLMLVDADLRDYPELNVARFVSVAYDRDLDFVLPLWCRPWGQANTTNYLASPLLRAAFGARVRQPLAGQMFLGRSFLQDLDADALPDDYGIDLAITIAALAGGRSMGQVVLPGLQHESRDGNSERIMFQVAYAALGIVAGSPPVERRDVSWPDRYWDRLEWPDGPSRETMAFTAIVEREAARYELAAGDEWRTLIKASSDEVADLWCAQLAKAVVRARAGDDLTDVARELVGPFFVHAEHRRRQPRPDIADAERYVADLGDRLAEHLGVDFGPEPERPPGLDDGFTSVGAGCRC